jgi:hypothetical protein
MKVRQFLFSALLSVPVLASANIAINGDFEDSVLGNGWTNTATTGFAALSAYNGCCGPLTGTYTGGAQSAFFGWGNLTGGSIWQDLPTVIGQAYVLSFDYGAIAAADLQTLTASVLGGGSFVNVLGTANVSATGTQALDTMLTTYSFGFTAIDTLTRIQFVDTSVTTNSVDGMLDNVSVSAVPEAEGYMMALAGIGLLTAAASRRKSN